MNLEGNNVSDSEKQILANYRKDLIEVKNKLNESYDKLVVTLSGGALALSITFLKDVIAVEEIQFSALLLFAWVCFVFSLASILGEILFGIEAQKRAIKQVDDGSIYQVKPGGRYSTITTFLHRFASVALIMGLLLISFFAFLNIGIEDEQSRTSTRTESVPPTAARTTD